MCLISTGLFNLLSSNCKLWNLSTAQESSYDNDFHIVSTQLENGYTASLDEIGWAAKSLQKTASFGYSIHFS